jgi:hypothetical protein
MHAWGCEVYAHFRLRAGALVEAKHQGAVHQPLPNDALQIECSVAVMADQCFAFEPNGPKRLRIRTEGARVRFFVDETLVNEASLKDAQRGLSCTLADGRVLTIEVRFRFLGTGSGWVLSLNGVPLPGSADDRERQMRLLATVYLAFAGCSAFLFLLRPGPNPDIVAAASYGAVGWLGHRGSWRALAVGFAIYVIESVLWLSLHFGVWSVLFRVLALIWFFNSVRRTRPPRRVLGQNV